MMLTQITLENFASALKELGHNPDDYAGKRLSIENMCIIYNIDYETILAAVDKNHFKIIYDYENDTIWVDGLEAAHFFYCIRSRDSLYKQIA